MGKFVVRTLHDGVQFRLHAANGGMIACSAMSASEQVCLAHIETVRRIAADAAVCDRTAQTADALTAPRYEIVSDETGRFCFRLLDETGAALMQSVGYKAKASCRSGIESVRRNAPGATIVK